MPPAATAAAPASTAPAPTPGGAAAAVGLWATCAAVVTAAAVGVLLVTGAPASLAGWLLLSACCWLAGTRPGTRCAMSFSRSWCAVSKSAFTSTWWNSPGSCRHTTQPSQAHKGLTQHAQHHKDKHAPLISSAEHATECGASTPAHRTRHESVAEPTCAFAISDVALARRCSTFSSVSVPLFLSRRSSSS
jgi:lysylphosphatidylglycerol synthetase-like protein (DUF2156 family)